MSNRNIDSLTLLETFVALMDQRSVSGAADALGISQSAVSKQLTKLRNAYGDQLFVRTSQGMLPTARAQAMLPKVQALLDDLEALKTPGTFDPALLSGDVTIVTTDELRADLVGPLLGLLDDVAPHLRLNLRALPTDYAAQALELGQVDLALAVDWHAPQSLRQRWLLEDRFMCVMRADHPLAKGALSLASYADARHALVAPLGMQRGYVDDVLAHQGLKREVVLSVPDFYGLADALVGGQLIATVPERVARRGIAQSSGALVLADPPIILSPIRYFAFWHERYHRSPRHQWLRETVSEIFRQSSRNDDFPARTTSC